MIFRILMAVVVLGLMQGCFLATHRAFVSEPADVVETGLKDVVNELRWHEQDGSGDVVIQSYLNTGILGYLPWKSQVVENPNLLISTDRYNPLHNTGTYGAVTLIPVAGGTAYAATFASESGDPDATARLLLELTKQEIAMRRGEMDPCANKMKSGWTYFGLNSVSPYLSARYVVRDNPLITPGKHRYFYFQNSLGDLAMAGLVTAGLLNDNRETRRELVIAGIATGAVWRIITLLNLVDLKDYNCLARSKYDLRMAKTQYHDDS